MLLLLPDFGVKKSFLFFVCFLFVTSEEHDSEEANSSLTLATNSYVIGEPWNGSVSGYVTCSTVLQQGQVLVPPAHNVSNNRRFPVVSYDRKQKC